MDEIRFVGDLQRLEVKPGDRFVLKVKGHIDIETGRRLQEQLVHFLGEGVKVAVLEDGMELGVIAGMPEEKR